MATLNYTTTVAVTRTVGEIQTMLGAAGASAVMIEYAAGEPSAVSFSLAGPHGDRAFRLPVDTVSMHKVLLRERRTGKIDRNKYATPEHAARVAWRVIKDWLEAQLALVAARMAQLDEVMLPYLVMPSGQTLYSDYRAREQAALEAGGES
jgi:hypothetical protein